MIQAVPRTYRGVRFRSTLEADWAATLDAFSIAWQYEPEAVQLPSGDLYRPDFYLPQCTTWLEVKGPHNDRLSKTRELGKTGVHYPACDGTWREPELHLSAWTAADERELEAILSTAPDGDTQIVVHIMEWIDEDRPTHGTRAMRTARLRRRVVLDRATREALHATRYAYWLPCCHGYNIPWRLVIIGRPATAGMTTWESAQDIDVKLIRCSECGQHSFFDETMLWTCRRCQATGEVYWGGLWESGDATWAGHDTMPFTRAPRGSAAA